MAVTKEQATVGDFTDVFKNLNGLVKENYMLGFETFLALVEENQKFVNSQLDQYTSLQKEFVDSVKEAYDGLPKGFNALPFSTNVDHFAESQKGYVTLARNFYDKISKNTLGLTQQTAENTFKAVEDYIKLFNV